MGDILPFPSDRRADLRVDICDPPARAPDGDAPPPHDLDAEAAVLSAILLSLEALLVVLEILKPEHFYSEANARIYQAAQHIHRDGLPVDIVTVVTWMRGKEWLEKIGGPAYVAQLADATPSTGHVAAHAETVLGAWRLRMVIATCHRVAAEARVGITGSAVDPFIASVRSGFGQITAPRAKVVGRPIHAVVQEARAHVQQATSGLVVGVRYPWAALEGMIGLLVTGRQTVLAGLSEHGKTAVAMQIAASVASTPKDDSGHGEAVYVHSGEMPGAALLLRTACSFAGVDVLTVEAGHAHPDHLAAVQHQFDWLSLLPIIIDDKPAPPVEVAARVRRWQALFAAGQARREATAAELVLDSTPTRLHPRCRLRLVVGDHLQILERCMPERDERERIAQCARGWDEDVAKACKVATLLLSQLRQPEPDRGKPSAWRWPIERDLFGAPTQIKDSADSVIAVTRPELFMQSKVPAKWIDVIAFSRLKSRFGGNVRRVKLGFDRGYISNDVPAAARGEAHYQDDDDT